MSEGYALLRKLGYFRKRVKWLNKK
jgi:hypothetical protein